ncbi:MULTISPECIES: glutathione S-transferase [Pseudomonas]|jgi:glutathione S-transferase|uniref:Glutathione S-transferase-like protein n=1 Tax=Pseudomonas mandelii JR-1 TaxID=1147786 RepID=A0A024E4J6_9PSED|nr:MULTISPECIES: glutathione S-transferase [Pseudomonas]MDF9881438.1 glutathione S-transferase [Pseudomonas silensiensis]AHZ67849.1 glutathione S-transferase-like protein [Pseudomonas mandelii JR-1]MDI1333976.1 glutathione S-transferase [Pseudomonas sp.]MDO8405214.1 glutathione S-transferase [Pseudomonas sp.]PMV79598.1 glutathione S-transferase [Pseudomonas sp. GW101-1A09]
MKLIGMLDSPYVRRVAISARHLGIDLEHESVSVFRHFEHFQQINPVVKAPTLVLDDGEVLIDSTLIIDYLEALAGPGKSLMPDDLKQRLRAWRLIGLGLAACEKSVQLYYERNLRPAEIQYQPWVERVEGQLAAAYSALERELEKQPLANGALIEQDGITLAVAWSFTNLVTPDQVDASRFPRIAEFTAQAEKLEAFISTPIT